MPSRAEPLFLVSLPRSGSTLLQRMLAAHGEVSSSPEPSFLLPLLHIDRSSDVVATFDQQYTAMAVQDFVTSLPAGRADYLEAVAGFARDLYGRAATPGARYHLDKTPKYHLVVEDLLEAFPDTPIVLLWRNPLAVVASLMTTWGRDGGRWNVGDFRIDLFEGLPNMLRVADAAPDRVLEVRYEELVAAPDATLARLASRLGLQHDAATVDDFGSVRLEGRIQDPNAGRPEFQQVRSDRVDRWPEVLANPLRRRWARRYLDWLGAERLARMGYDHAELHAQLDGGPRSTAFLATDLIDMPLDVVSRLVELRLVRQKLGDRRAGRPLLAHK